MQPRAFDRVQNSTVPHQLILMPTFTLLRGVPVLEMMFFTCRVWQETLGAAGMVVPGNGMRSLVCSRCACARHARVQELLLT